MKLALLALALVAPFAAIAQTDPRQVVIDKTFAAIDTNHDSRIDKNEYTAYQQARFTKQGKAMNDAFTALDVNKDGKVSKDEAAVVPEIARYFDGLDIDKDGLLSLSEMQRAMIAAQAVDNGDK